MELLIDVLRWIIGPTGRSINGLVRLKSRASRSGNLICARFISNKLQKYGVYIAPEAEIGVGCSLPHPVGIVIGSGVKIGKSAVIYQNVTIGGARKGDYSNNNYPVIGDGVTIFAGAVIIGKIRIGNNCVIGANSVVNVDLPDGCLGAGVPAKIYNRSN